MQSESVPIMPVHGKVPVSWILVCLVKGYFLQYNKYNFKIGVQYVFEH